MGQTKEGNRQSRGGWSHTMKAPETIKITRGFKMGSKKKEGRLVLVKKAATQGENDY